MAKPELGTKRLCANCSVKFYDLSKNPIVCPKCETVFHVVTPVSRARPDAVAAAAAAAAVAAAARAKAAESVKPEPQDTELVSLEDADAEAQGGKVKAPAGDAAEGDDDIEIDEPIDDAALIEQQEEGDEDVTDIVGEGRENEEET